jgi:hypothetical protein
MLARVRRFLVSTNLTLPILKLAYFWMHNIGRDDTASMTGISKPTVTAYFNYLKQLAADDVGEHHVVIGGQGITVEIDESKFGRRICTNPISTYILTYVQPNGPYQ